MYSLGIRGSWWEKTFWRPTSHIKIFLLGFWLRELPMTWNSITPRLSSNRAASSRAEWAERRLVWQMKMTRLKNSLLPSGLCFLSWMVFNHRLVLLQCKTQFTTPSNFSVTFKLPLVTSTTYRTKLTDCVPLARAWQQDPWWWTWPH